MTKAELMQALGFKDVSSSGFCYHSFDGHFSLQFARAHHSDNLPLLFIFNITSGDMTTTRRYPETELEAMVVEAATILDKWSYTAALPFLRKRKLQALFD